MLVGRLSGGMNNSVHDARDEAQAQAQPAQHLRSGRRRISSFLREIDGIGGSSLQKCILCDRLIELRNFNNHIATGECSSMQQKQQQQQQQQQQQPMASK